MMESTDNGVDFEMELITKNKNKMENQTLYKITESYSELMQTIEEAEGILTPEMEEALTINEDQLQKKSIGYLEVIKTKEAFNMVIDEEVKRLTAIKKRNNALTNSLKERLLNAVKLFGEYSVGTVTFMTRKSTSVLIEDSELISNDFKTRKVVETPDKKKIGDALKSGEEVAGASLSHNLSLRIK